MQSSYCNDRFMQNSPELDFTPFVHTRIVFDCLQCLFAVNNANVTLDGFDECIRLIKLLGNQNISMSYAVSTRD